MRTLDASVRVSISDDPPAVLVTQRRPLGPLPVTASPTNARHHYPSLQRRSIANARKENRKVPGVDVGIGVLVNVEGAVGREGDGVLC